MRITLLGTGDAVGTPRVGCSCPNCTTAVAEGLSRLRTSLLLEVDGKHILVDTSPDLRQQLLKSGSPYIDAVIRTHGHYDHYSGYGDF
ncbi:MAG TPA: MBL fold metallo-hydrolase, partial [Methanomicrobiales archaeon]|nr:MBL fold metallo-hydrolase [Methanomicrobiales archaeon]